MVPFSHRAAFISFRLIILLLVLFFVSESGPNALHIGPEMLDSYKWIFALAAFQFVSNFLLLLFREGPAKKGLMAGLFFYDIGLISWAIYATQGFESDIFLVYFLAIFMTVIAKKPSISFAVAGISCVIYGALFVRANSAAGLMETSVLIRFPLLLVTAFFSSVIVQGIEEEKEGFMQKIQAFWMHSEKLVAVGEMAQGIAHKINNPLTSILGMTQVLLSGEEEVRQGEKGVWVAAEDLGVIERNAARCRKILEDLLLYSSAQEFCFEKVDVKEIILKALDLLKHQVRSSKIRVEWQDATTPETRLVHGSFVHLTQVFFNLIMNSVQAMPQGGLMTISLERQNSITERNMASECVRILMEDSGSGAPWEIDRRIFEKGLGLATAESMILKHNGKMKVSSRAPVKGNHIEIQLPCYVSTEAAVSEGVPS